EAGLRERPGAARAVRVASGLETFLHDAWRKAPDDATLLRLLCRTGDSAALKQLTARCLDDSLLLKERADLLAVLGEVGSGDASAPLLSLVGRGEPQAVQLAALSAWQRLGTDAQAAELIAAYPGLAAAVKARARAVLLS